MISCPKASPLQHLDKYNSARVCKALEWVVDTLLPFQPSSPDIPPGLKLEIMISEVFSNLMGPVLPTGSQSFPRAGSVWSVTGLGTPHEAYRPVHGTSPGHTHRFQALTTFIPSLSKPFGPMQVTVLPQSAESALTLFVLGSGQGGAVWSQQRPPRIRPCLTRKG